MIVDVMLSDKMTVGDLTLGDYPQLPPLWTASGIDWTDVDTEEKFARLLSRNKGVNGTCFSSIVRLSDKVVGVLLCGDDGLCAHIYHVAVDPKFRRYGIGTMLAKRTLGELKASGAKECRLFVRYANEIGGAFWESLGFSPRVSVYSMNIKFL